MPARSVAWALVVTSGMTLLLLVSVSAAVGGSQASQQTPPRPVDVVVALDNSGSMRVSDPEGKRIDAARNLVATLTLLTDLVDSRVGGVTFGSRQFTPGSRIVKPLTPVTEPGVAESFVAENLAGTDLKSALCLAWTTVAVQAPPTNSGCDVAPLIGEAIAVPKRQDSGVRRVVVIMTDGFPAPGGEDLAFPAGAGPENCNGRTDGHGYMCELMSTWSTLTSTVYSDLFVVGIDQDDVWFPKVEPYWRFMTGCTGDLACARAVRRSANASTLTRDLLESAAGATTNLCNKAAGSNLCDLPASLAQVQFIVDGLGASDSVQIVAPDGAVQAAGSRVAVRRAGQTERWAITGPPRGTWQVLSSNPDATLSVSTVLVPISFNLSITPEAPTSGDDVTIGAMLNSASEVDQASIVQQNYELEVSQNGIDQPTRTVGLTLESTGRFTLSEEIQHVTPGSWKAVLVLPVSGRRLSLGQIDFAVSDAGVTTTPARETPTERGPTPTSSPNVCVSQSGEAISPVGDFSAFSLGFDFDWRVRFRVPTRVTADLTECSGANTHWRMTLASVGSDEPCDDCVTERVGPGNLSMTLPKGLQRNADIDRRVEVLDGDTWKTVADDEVAISVPLLARIELWATIIAPFLLFVLILSAASLYSTFMPFPTDSGPIPLRKLGVMGPEGFSQPVVRLGAWAWRWADARDGQPGLLTFRWLFFGPLVMRLLSSDVPELQESGDEQWSAKALIRVRRLLHRLMGSPVTESKVDVVEVRPATAE